jgi:hypothetical protein
MSKKILFIAAILFITIVSITWAQDAVTFSFASDDNHAGRNFYCHMTDPHSIVASRVPVNLITDRNDTVNGGLVTIQSYMYFRGVIHNYQMVPHNGNFLHIWSLEGYIYFYHVDTPLIPVLRITFNNAVLTSYSPVPNAAGETLTFEVSESVDPNIHMTPMNLLPGIGVNPVNLSVFEDFALTFTNVNTGGGTILIPLAGGVFADDWQSEGSFSGSGATP